MWRREILALPLVLATLALLRIVPGPPWNHLDDPAHWGVIGYVLTLGVLIGLRARGIRANRRERDLYAAFLFGMPVIYLAAWLRFGGEMSWLGIELLGAVIYWTLAWLGVRRSPWYLAGGIAAHALWDVWHYDATHFIPNWYVVGCVVIDLGLGLYVAGLVRWLPPGEGWSDQGPPVDDDQLEVSPDSKPSAKSPPRSIR